MKVLWVVFATLLWCGLGQVTPASNWVPTAKLGPQCLTSGGFPGSPKTVKPWVSSWQNPPESHPQPVSTAFPYSAEYQGRKIEYHEIHAINQDIQVFVPGTPTKFFSYKLPSAAAGTVPGPTIRACKGVMTVVRFKNMLEGPDNRYSMLGIQHPGHAGNRGAGPDECSVNYTNPWPIQIHLHGSGSLAPYDGWADSVLFSGCGKDFVYPNNRAGIAWYHDHAVHETSYNAYTGLASQYWVDDCCSEMEDTLPSGPYRLPFIIRDATFDAKDQLFYDPAGIHRDNFYGDHILVNGVPWPVLHVERRQYRFSLHVAAITRPMHFQFKDQPDSYFLVIGSDGGFRQEAIRTNTIRAAVAERWDVIIDFAQTAFAGQTEVILYNIPLYNIPQFCQTHLVAKFIIDLPTTPTQFLPAPKHVTNVFVPIPPLPAPLPPSGVSPFTRPVDPLRPVTAGEKLFFLPRLQSSTPIPIVNAHPLSAPLIPDAFLALAADPKVTPRRKLSFGRSGGRWSISTFDYPNGTSITVGGGSQTWGSTANFEDGQALPVEDQWTTRTGLPEHVTAEPAQNTLEVWEIVNGGGGWFHPIHIHLVDFFLTYRKGGVAQFTHATGPDGLADYERLAAKDVVFLGPGETLRVVARYGPHGGNYMMHCHNLVHEDDDMLIAFKVIPGKALVFTPEVGMNEMHGGLDLDKDPEVPFDEALGVAPVPNAELPKVDVNYLASHLQSDLYRLMYPPEQAFQGYPVDWTAAPYFSRSKFIAPFVNPWEVPYVTLDRPEICPAFHALHKPAPGSTSFYAQVSEDDTIGAVTGVLQVAEKAADPAGVDAVAEKPVVDAVAEVVKTTLKNVKSKSKDKKMKVVVLKL
eukprot:TRINITY_DN3830_c0_g1_i1.p1 TRINITY_DN3830_c0_g1~~TRINITY_DN3830_c0_g1_i1.p1  ORF type:complete len:858 (+),score=125.66 TRINITY_DN3830_c0_g1_i1:87-2660(+)